jgi:hypothetical protein
MGTTTLRSQILTLQQQLAAEQPQVATDLKTLVQSSDVAALLAQFQAIQDRAMPNGPIDSQISNIITVFANISVFAVQNVQMQQTIAAQNGNTTQTATA